MANFATSHIDAIDEIDDGRAPFRPVRHHFGISTFGVNAFVARAAGDRLINEHDEEGEHEELYLVQRGRARFELDGKTVDAPAGTLIFAEPGVKRTAFAEEDGTALLAIGGQPGQAYRAQGYELWAPLDPLYREGKYEEIADRADAVLADDPPYGGLYYNIACCEALAGRKDAAIRHVQRAVELDEGMRELAKGDTDLDSLRDDPGFRQLVA